MKRTRHLRHRRKVHRTRKHRGGGGCFHGICYSNKAVNVEVPGTKPANLPVTYENPLRKAAHRNLNANGMSPEERAELDKIMANVDNGAGTGLVPRHKAAHRNLNANGLTPEERAEFDEFMASMNNGSGAGTGLAPGEEVNINSINLGEFATGDKNLNKTLRESYRQSQILSRPLQIKGMPTDEELAAELEAIEKSGKARKTRKNHRGGGGCIGFLCSSNKSVAVEVPGVKPDTQVVNPMASAQNSLGGIEARIQTLEQMRTALQTSIAELYQGALEDKIHERKNAGIRKLREKAMKTRQLQQTEGQIYNLKAMRNMIVRTEKLTRNRAAASSQRKNRKSRRAH